jgi:hypothetical protein
MKRFSIQPILSLAFLSGLLLVNGCRTIDATRIRVERAETFLGVLNPTTILVTID